jgi:hypothetical protein
VPLIHQLKKTNSIELCNAVTCDGDKLPPEGVAELLLKADSIPLEMGGPRPMLDSELAALDLAFIGEHELTEFALVSANKHLGFNPITGHPAVLSGLGFAFDRILGVPLIHLLRIVYDIRRFGMAERPERMSRFRSYFRLASPRPFFALFRRQGTDIDSETLGRTNLLLLSWAQHPLFFMSDRELAKPGGFLYREFRASVTEFLESKNEDEAKVLATWRTSVRLATFVYRLWLHGVGGTRFEPNKFFKQQEEAEEFVNYAKKIDSGKADL